jgi:hypothetical protein
MKTLKLNLKVAGFLITCLAFSNMIFAADLTNGLKLHYNFENVANGIVPDASGNGYNGTLVGATTGLSNGKNSLKLGTSGTDYLDMGATTGNLIASLNDFTISVYIWVNSTNTNINSNGNFICVFANSQNSGTDQNGVIFLQAKRSRYAITATYWNAEQAVQTGVNVVKGKWVQMIYTQAGTTGKLYVDGVLKNTNANVTLLPSAIGATPYNYLGKPTYSGDINLQDTQLSDFRIYNRAITNDEILMLNGYPAELINAYESLNLTGDLTNIRNDISLPATAGTANIPVVWTSSLPANISETGVVTRPEQYDATVKLTGTISMVSNGVTYSLKKEFTAIVKAFAEKKELVAKWDFTAENIYVEEGKTKVKDASDSKFVGTVMNEARIRTIGSTEQFNVLDLGNATGYFDMGTDIGKAIYAMNNYSITGFYRIDDDYASLTNNGNFMWNFSNTDNAPTDQNGYMLGRLNNVCMEITPYYYASGNQAVLSGSAAAKGAWHHYAYVQNGTTGTLYIDGVQSATATVTNIPATTLPIAGRTGTIYNWLGRPCYPTDTYLKKTLLYDFQVYNLALTQDNLNLDFEVPATIDRLNAAYAENPDFISETVTNEAASLDLGNLSAVSADLTLPLKGTLDPAISISWKSSNEQIISSTGKVTRPDYFNFNVTLTATLVKGAQLLTKTFHATVLVKEGTQFTGDLIAKYDFSSVDGRFVNDLGEKKFQATTVNEASIRSIGNKDSGMFNVLDLGNGTGYLDLGTEIGKVMYGLEDYTLSAYYRIDTAYHSLGSLGNFIWCFSNSTNSGTDANGYIIFSLKNQEHSITPGNWSAASGNQAVAFQQLALQGGWHNVTYTQGGTVGSLYLDGMLAITGDITNTPKSALPKSGLTGTPYNWVGRSNYTGDVYLRQSLVYDFRLYKRALTDMEILATELNVPEVISKLDLAYAANPNIPQGLFEALRGPYKLTSENGIIRISGLEGDERVRVYDISGRRINIVKNNEIQVGSGMYIVKINNFTTKLMVD